MLGYLHITANNSSVDNLVRGHLNLKNFDCWKDDNRLKYKEP